MKSIYQTATFVCQVGLPVENSVHHKKNVAAIHLKLTCQYPLTEFVQANNGTMAVFGKLTSPFTAGI